MAKDKYLCVVARITLTVPPGADTNVQLALRKPANEFLESRTVLGGPDALDITVSVEEDEALELFLLLRAGLVVGFVAGLHEVGHAFTCGWVAVLLDGQVATGADDDADVEGVITWTRQMLLRDKEAATRTYLASRLW